MYFYTHQTETVNFNLVSAAIKLTIQVGQESQLLKEKKKKKQPRKQSSLCIPSSSMFKQYQRVLPDPIKGP